MRLLASVRNRIFHACVHTPYSPLVGMLGGLVNSEMAILNGVMGKHSGAIVAQVRAQGLGNIV